MQNNWGPELHAALIDRSFAAPPDPADRAALLAYAAKIPAAAALAAVRSQRDLDFTPGLGEIRCPVTVIHGELDTARTVEHAQELADGIPGARLCLVRTGHTPVYEAPEKVAREVVLLSRIERGYGR